MNVARWVALASFAAGVAVGCSSSSSHEPPVDNVPPSPTTAAQFVEQARAAVCKHLIACGAMSDEQLCIASGMAVDPHWWPGVVATNRQDMVWDYLVQDVDAGLVRYDTDAAAACLEALTMPICAYYDYIPQVEAACDSVFSGTLAQGESCMPYRRQCGGELAYCGAAAGCDTGTGCCESTCSTLQAPKPELKVGDSCSDNPNCPEGSYCDFDTVTCTQGEPDGTPCGMAGQNVRCAGACDTGQHVCYTAGREGEPCNPEMVFSCFIGSQTWCNPDTMICERMLAAGEACGIGGAPCVGAFQCVGDSCQWEAPAPGPSEPCEWVPSGDGGMEAHCLGRLSCDSADNCTLEPLPGECD